MTTSGTVGLTKISTAVLVNKAIRRCGLNPLVQTPEILSTATEDLFMLILSLANRGINLWCVERILLPVIIGQARYELPPGTERILNVLQSSPTLLEGVTTILPSSHMVEYEEPVQVTRIGFRLHTSSSQLQVQVSDDGFLWERVEFIEYPPRVETFAGGQLYWLDLKKTYLAKFLRLVNVVDLPQTPSPLLVTLLYVCSQSREIAMSAFNRDDYANQPNKTFTSQTITNYYFEKLIDPTMTFWPVPQTDQNCVIIYRQRQIQDIGDLQEEIEIPSRWYEAITWHLALRLAFEIPGVDPGRISAIQKMTQDMTLEVEGGETDDSPVNFAPRIGVYTR